MLGLFAGPQIRNVSVSNLVRLSHYTVLFILFCSSCQALGGNVCNASPISDLNPLLMAARAVVNLASVDGVRSIAVNTSFFTGYKRTALKPNEVLVSIVIPFTTKVCSKTHWRCD